jgi:hypothetical protein
MAAGRLRTASAAYSAIEQTKKRPQREAAGCWIMFALLRVAHPALVRVGAVVVRGHFQVVFHFQPA